MDLQTIWFGLVGVLLIGYAVLDGFDLGAGILSLFSRGREKRVFMNAIAPVWDGNEVWLLAVGGSLFAAFPKVYAGVFSGFYIAMMLLLAALIFRAVSLEFYGKVESDAWRRAWGLGFGLGSLLTALLLGVAFGNVLRGIPIAAGGDYTGTFLGLLNPYALLIGILTLCLFTMHGAAYMAIKTDGDVQSRMQKWGVAAWWVCGLLYLAATAATLFAAPFLFTGLMSKPMAYVALVPLFGGIALFPGMLRAGRHLAAFIASSCAMAGMIAMAGISLYPCIVPSTVHAAYSLRLDNASSSNYTLWVMLIVALLGIPPMLAYTAYVYWVFKGKISLDGY